MMQESAVVGQAAPVGDDQRADRRKSARRRVLKDGKLIFGPGKSVVDCTIDNMSDGGAHVRLVGSHGLPPEFYLAEASKGIVHKAEVAWRTTAGIGLKLLATLDDAAAQEALPRKFRRA
jgi:hypothetical protein